MKTTKLSLALAGLMIASSIIVTSCKKKDNTTATDSDTSAAADHTMAENTASDVGNMVAEASEQGSLSSYRLGSGQESVSAISCATMTYDTINKIITANFGAATSPSTCLDGRTRSGSLTFNYSASPTGANHYRNPGFTCTVSSQNYIVDGNAVTINKTILNTTSPTFNSTTTNMTWSITASVSIVKASNGGTVTWNCNRVKTLLNTSDANVYHGQATHITWSSAKVGLTGSATGTTASGSSFTANINSQLVRDLSCAPDANRPGRHPFIQGDIDFTPGTKATRHIDYGSGTCDLAATVTINGVSYPITLP
ncbi:MAG: hypothetical protein ABI388_01920 [Bacteroidia bacterium]